jgi:Ca2+/Na+ antiporter
LSIALVIFAATIIVSLVGLYAAPQLIERSLFRPYWFLRGRQYATLLTSGFMHADLPHLIFNMVTFWFFAFPLERRIGSIAFAVLYIVSLALSLLGTYLKHRDDQEYASLGASGASRPCCSRRLSIFPGRSSSSCHFQCRSLRHCLRSCMSPTRGTRPVRIAAGSTTMRT